MISLFYKLRLFNYILSSLKDIAVKLFLLTGYFYMSSIILMFFSNGFQYVTEFGSFKSAFYYLYQYLKWYWENKDDLDYGVSIRILVAFFIPYLLYKLFLSINWRPFVRHIITQVLRLMRRKKSNELNKASSNGYSNRTNYVNNTSYGYDHNSDQDAKKKVDMIKQLLMKDIEQTIDKRLHNIFFGKKNKSH